jgi:PAS domain S-box-containing protein
MEHIPFYNNGVLLFLSVILAYSISFAAVEVIRHASGMSGRFQKSWVIISGIILGAGIWSMHFVGILGIIHSFSFNKGMTIMALVISAFSSVTTMSSSFAALSGKRGISSAVLLCISIFSMHFSGMAAMDIEGTIVYNPYMIVISIAVSFIFSYLCFHRFSYAQRRKHVFFQSSMFMGTAICGTHYIVIFGTYVNGIQPVIVMSGATTPHYLTAMMITAIMLILCLGLVAAVHITNRLLKQMSALSETRQLLWKLFQHSNDIIIIMGVKDPFEVLTVNETALNRWGLAPVSIIGTSFLELWPAHSAESIRNKIMNAANDAEGTFESERLLNRGDHQYCQVRIQRVSFAGEQTYAAIIRDVTSARRLEMLLAIKKQILIMIAKDYPINETLEMICKAVEEQTVGSTCSISLVDEQEGKLWIAAGSKLSGKYVKEINGIKIGDQQGSCGTAVFRNEMVLVPDIHRSPLWSNYADAALREGYRSCYSAPIRSGSGTKVYGALAVYLNESRDPNEYELQLLDKMSYLAGLAFERHGVKGLKRNVELYRLISENVSDLVWLVDEQEMIQYVSPSLSLFKTLDSTTGCSIWNIIDPEDEDAMKAAIFTAKTDHKNQSIEFKLNSEGKVSLILEASIIPFPAFFGEGRGSVIIVAKDVTARKDAEMKLEESRQRFKSLYHNHPAVIYSFDVDGRFIDANEAAERITGYSFNELRDHSYDFMVKEEDLSYTREMFNKAVQGLPQAYEVSLIHNNGQYVHMQVTNLPIIVNSQIVGVHGVAHDITDKIRLQEELQQARLELEEAVHHLDGLLFKMKRSGDRVFFTMAGGNLLADLGFTAEDIYGREWDEVFSDKLQSADLQDNFLKVWEGEQGVSFQTKWKGLVYSFRFTPVIKYGRVSEIVGICLKAELSETGLVPSVHLPAHVNYSILENMTDVALLVDQNGKVLFVTEGCKTTFGYHRQEMEQLSVDDFILSVDINGLSDPLTSVSNIIRSKFIIKHKVGRKLQLEGIIKPVKLQGEEEVKLLMIYPYKFSLEGSQQASLGLARCAINKLRKEMNAAASQRRLQIAESIVESLLLHEESSITTARCPTSLKDIVKDAVQVILSRESNRGNSVIFRTVEGTEQVACNCNKEELQFAFEMLLERLFDYKTDITIDIALIEDKAYISIQPSNHSLPLADLVLGHHDFEDQAICQHFELIAAKLIIEEYHGSLVCYSQGEHYSLIVMLPSLEEDMKEALKDPNTTIFLCEKLTKREWEVAELIGSGKSNKEIASELKISENTVKNHVANIFNKLSIEERGQVAVLINHYRLCVGEMMQ